MKSFAAIVAFGLIAAVQAQDQCAAVAAKIPGCAVSDPAGIERDSWTCAKTSLFRSTAFPRPVRLWDALAPPTSPASARTPPPSTLPLFNVCSPAVVLPLEFRFKRPPAPCATVSRLLGQHLRHLPLLLPPQPQKPLAPHPPPAAPLLFPQSSRSLKLPMARFRLLVLLLRRPPPQPVTPRSHSREPEPRRSLPLVDSWPLSPPRSPRCK